MAKTDGDYLTLITENDHVLVACDEDLILYVPRSSALTIESVAGDANIQALQGPLRLGPVAGDVTMHEAGAVEIETVSGDVSLRNIADLSAKVISGDFTLRGCKGDCILQTVGGDASLRDVQGDVVIHSIGSDLYARNIYGNLNVTAGADIALYLEPSPGHIYHASASDDLLLRLPGTVSVELHLVSTNPDNIQVDIPGVELSGKTNAYDLTIGAQTDNIAKMYLSAGDDLLVTSRAEAWDSAADFGIGMADSGNLQIPPIPLLPANISERIHQRIRSAVERSQERAEAASRRAALKIEAAMRRAEAKARTAEVRTRRGQVQIHIGRRTWDSSPQRPAEKDEPVSDEERLQILRMLQQKKITIEEAEKLLAALEGK
ncbi:MAG: DUF4097 family beta strand repeat-containing protein [Anaerolineales bacterium]|nr:DUF4097 family beta strand repeat-containing protein [Anaerolineales bacterium]